MNDQRSPLQPFLLPPHSGLATASPGHNDMESKQGDPQLLVLTVLPHSSVTQTRRFWQNVCLSRGETKGGKVVSTLVVRMKLIYVHELQNTNCVISVIAFTTGNAQYK